MQHKDAVKLTACACRVLVWYLEVLHEDSHDDVDKYELRHQHEDDEELSLIHI